MTEQTVTLDDALQLLSLPRERGAAPDDGEPIVANLGRFGPYVKHGNEFRSLESEERLFTVTLDEARGAAGASRRSRGAGSRAAKTVLRELGPHPKSGARSACSPAATVRTSPTARPTRRCRRARRRKR